MNKDFYIEYGIASDIGHKRKNNEDSWLINASKAGLAGKHDLLFIVADGMGGGPAGELASQLAVQEVQNKYFASTQERPGEALGRAVLSAHDKIRREVMMHPQYAGMGTTLTALVLADRAAHIAHVGDSRAYLIRDNQIVQLTQDQTIISNLISSGEITPEEARIHPQRNILTQSVGGGNWQPQTEIVAQDILIDDVFVLCSDGLYNMLSDNEIKETINNDANPQNAAELLINQANTRGGLDNITVMIIKIDGYSAFSNLMDRSNRILGNALTGLTALLPGK